VGKLADASSPEPSGRALVVATGVVFGAALILCYGCAAPTAGDRPGHLPP
jgi:hypothetical protein